MKLFAISTFASLALLVGCAASSSDSADVGQDEITSRPQIELKGSSDEKSVQATLFKLIAMGGESGPTVTLKGHEQGATRSISCTASRLISAVVGQGVSSTTFYGCTLDGFDKVAGGGSLPSVILPASGDEPLAGKLFALLVQGEKKGGLGIKRLADEAAPPCCDIPVQTTYTLSDANNTLSCSMSSGGFAFIRSAACTLVANAADDAEVKKGTLVHTVGIGGENTGFSVKSGNDTLELVLDKAAQAEFVPGRVARVTGTPTTLSGVETHDRPAIKVTNLLVCPAPKSTLDMMPPVSDDTLWISKNCPDLGDIVE